MATHQGDQDAANRASGSQRQPLVEQASLTQGDISKIVELIVKQLPVPSNTTPAASQMPLASTSSQAPSTTPPGTVTSSLPISSFSPSMAGITETSYITPPQVENALEGDGSIAGGPVHLPLTVPGA